MGDRHPRAGEFLHVNDLANAAFLLMRNYDSGDIINAGVGEDLTIAELAATIRDIVGYAGAIRYDASKPDGTPRKVLDVSRHGKPSAGALPSR